MISFLTFCGIYAVGMFLTWTFLLLFLANRKNITGMSAESDIVDTALKAFGLSLIWPITVWIPPALKLMRSVIYLNDKRYLSWEPALPWIWAETLYDPRTGESGWEFRCKFCHGDIPKLIVNEALEPTPCQKEECATVMSLDDDIKQAIKDEEVRQSLRRAIPNATGTGTWQPLTNNPIWTTTTAAGPNSSYNTNQSATSHTKKYYKKLDNEIPDDLMFL